MPSAVEGSFDELRGEGRAAHALDHQIDVRVFDDAECVAREELAMKARRARLALVAYGDRTKGVANAAAPSDGIPFAR